jgi:DNA-binding NarL/FixJ family response regulator
MIRPRLLLADDHTLVLEGFRRLLEPEFDVVGTVEDGQALLAAAETLQPDLVLVDVSMPGLNGIEVVRRLKKTAPRIKTIVVTMHTDPAYVTEAFRAGASGYLLKRSATDELVKAIHDVLQGRSYLTPLITKETLRSLIQRLGRRATGASVLTPRQRQVLKLVAEGCSAKEIATRLNVSVKTVEFHKARIMEQLDLHTTAELTKYAIASGLVTL